MPNSRCRNGDGGKLSPFLLSIAAAFIWCGGVFAGAAFQETRHERVSRETLKEITRTVAEEWILQQEQLIEQVKLLQSQHNSIKGDVYALWSGGFIDNNERAARVKRLEKELGIERKTKP